MAAVPQSSDIIVPTVPREGVPHQSEYNEKRDSPPTSESEEEEIEETFDDHDVTKPFPIDPHEPDEPYQLTIRALFVGCCLGAVVGASNIYLGLKTGFTFGPQLFGALFGYAILKPISKALPESGLIGRWFGGPFGPKENCTVQTAATAAGGIGILFVGAFPAMYRLNLLSPLPQQDIGKILALTVSAGFFGIFFVIPLRKYYIVHQKLTFPTPAATAYTIRSLHKGRSGAIIAKKKSLALLYTFIVCFIFRVVASYAPGVIFDWHIGWTLYRLGFTSIIALENYGWWIEFTPAFFGAGMLSGLNASWSFLGGAVLAWGIIAPSLVKNGLAVVSRNKVDPNIFSVMSLNFINDPSEYITSPSPRYWLLWPGVLMMLLYSFADIFCSLLPFFTGMRRINFAQAFKDIFVKRELHPDDEDQTPLEDRVPTLWWTVGLALSTIMSCALLATLFPLNVGEALLALILGFIFSFIGVQSSGATDVNPVSTVAKASQLIFGGIAKGQGMAERPSQVFNLTAGVIAGGSAAQASDMTGDLKTGYLLRAKPKNQFVAQLCGSVVAVFLNAGLFILFTKASPCIIDPNAETCTYGAPSVSAWAAVAIAVSAPRLPIPPSSGYTAIGLAIFAVISVCIKHLFIPRKYWHWVPNWNAVGLAFVVPQVYYAIAMGVGSVINYFWAKRNPKSYDLYMFAVAAGLLAGEGLGGVFNALLAVIGVDGGKFGTAIGCPLNEYCG
ncbi:oligopeptide transporter [Moniliophthora roreri MCA 2997]|uniref:Oligopeptide transporter n=1 Tax=Moniliophthora roreri (strain MCA 2997) TaxID=1381753 RepID=V2WP14_MONRO|nr:oligopeptide transporter [Moniliophthora roreri MCA 2997]